jgi:guanylate kinase
MYDYVVENDDLDETFGAILDIYDASQHSTHLRANQMQDMLGENS